MASSLGFKSTVQCPKNSFHYLYNQRNEIYRQFGQNLTLLNTSGVFLFFTSKVETMLAKGLFLCVFFYI